MGDDERLQAPGSAHTRGAQVAAAQSELTAKLAALEALERLNVVLRRHASHERGHQQLVDELTAVVRAIFEADRAFVIAHDPDDRRMMHIVAEAVVAPWPSSMNLIDGAIAISPATHAVLARLPRSHEPMTVLPDGDIPIPDTAARFQVRSILVVDVSPTRAGQRWALGLHQCSHARRWTAGERRLFQDVGVRVSEALAASFALSELRRSEERLQSVLDAVPDLMAVFDRDGRIRHVWTQRGESRELRVTHVGRTIADVWPRETADDVLATIREVIALGEVAQHDYSLVFNGTRRWLSARVGPLGPDSDPQVIWLARDVTTERLLAGQVRARQKLESLGVLAGGVAHDFNNLLVAVLGNAGLLLDPQRDRRSSSDDTDPLREIVDAAQHGHALCQKLLAYAGREQPDLAPVDLRDAVARAVEMLRLTIEGRAHLLFEAGREPVPVLADDAQLHQLLGQLVTNACEALPGGEGRIWIGCGVAELGAEDAAMAIAARPLRPGRCAFVEVRDEGHGLDAETRARIFDPFFSTRFLGRGLGLPAALGIAQAHGGGVLVVSEPGAGATFRVILPLAPSATLAPGGPRVAGAAQPSESPTLVDGTITVLVADDDLSVRRLLQRALTRAGFETLLAAGGREALARFSERAADVRCVILDLSMPDLRGDAVLRLLREQRASVPVLVISGFDEQDVIDELLSTGRTDFLAKPFGPGELISRVRALIDAASEGSTARHGST